MSNSKSCRNTNSFGLSINKELYLWIEKNRGNINRSKFISRVLEKSLIKKDHNVSIPVDQGLATLDQQVLDHPV